MSRRKYQHSDNSLGWRLRKFRESRADDVVSFSKLLKISQSSLSAYENNKTPISSEAIINLRQNTDINIDWLLIGEGDMTRQPKNNELQVAEKIDDGGLRKLLIGVQKILERRENEVNILKDLINFLTDREERIREGDPPEKKEEFINMRATSTG